LAYSGLPGQGKVTAMYGIFASLMLKGKRIRPEKPVIKVGIFSRRIIARRQGDFAMIDPTIAAAIITASGGLIEKLLELAGKAEPSAQNSEAGFLV
jgi:hypothetical protein